MLWNHLLHVVAGVIGATIFNWSGAGILTAGIVAAVTQAIDTVRMNFYHRDRILQAPPDVREQQMKAFKQGAVIKLVQLYVVKVCWYAVVLLLAAYVTRNISA